MNDFITINHGNGGRMTHDLVENLFAAKFGLSKPLTDSAILAGAAAHLAFTTDSYVIDPLFFPGGDIGKLAVCGTVNDLAVSGAVPKYISASFIIEEGFSYKELEMIVGSMASEASVAGVRIVTGDTKVVEKGKCDKLFINTSGVGILDPGRIFISSGKKVEPGDKLIVNGNLADHAAAVLSARKQLRFSSTIRSDCASLNRLIGSVLENNIRVTFMRDITRGGLATVASELASAIGWEISLGEALIPVDEQVKGLCEMLGFDPLYMANEGKVLFVVSDPDSAKALEILKSDPLGTHSRIIGEVTGSRGHAVVLHTVTGGKRLLGMLSGMQLPRIC